MVSCDGTQIGWYQAGKGPPIVLVHGACGDKGNWIGCTPYLSPSRTLYAIDRRGRGRSGDAPRYSIEREYEDVAAVVAAAGRPVTLIGHSYGAIVSLGAAKLTNRVAQLVLYEPPLLAAAFLDCEEWAERIEVHIDNNDRSVAVTEFLQRVATSEEITRLRNFPPAWEQLCRDCHTVPRELRSLKKIQYAAFEDVSLPTMLLVGKRTVPFLRSSVEHLAGMLSFAKKVELSEQGHLAQAFAPELLCREVLSFVRGMER